MISLCSVPVAAERSGVDTHPDATLAHTGNTNINFLNIRLSKFAGN